MSRATDNSHTAAFEAARDFAEHGLKVLPCHTVAADGRCTCGKADCNSPGKHPRTPNGLTNATTDERALLHWDASFPGANWAAAVGNIVSVVDIDAKHGRDSGEVIGALGLTGPVVWTGEATDGPLAGTRGAHVYCSPGARTVT
ncbi:hypothetical protein DSM104329_00626 [Capillimicrobium parvum]|uniref:DNA primase/polymerase bifunctional N-terminal domain-containing protein n=1 Tax=Capillimicrobium parvum TaxID=2884022 RepID=A0A9E6XTF2_9ACTN|nr:hypothetical protein DSM104329_00626 [Capillimicrobium parvum]